jgi:methylenetetrahydrofolate reductase (NADPH)
MSYPGRRFDQAEIVGKRSVPGVAMVFSGTDTKSSTLGSKTSCCSEGTTRVPASNRTLFDLDSMGLSRLARNIRDGQKLMSGQKIGGNANFLIGTADAPCDPPAGWETTRLKAKVDAGAQFAQTQFCMDAKVVRRYVQCLADNGLGDFFLLIGIAPIRSARSARWIRDKLPGSIIPDAVIERLERSTEPSREGRRICLELVEELSQLSGAAGVHIMAPGNDAGLAEIVAEAARISRK